MLTGQLRRLLSGRATLASAACALLVLLTATGCGPVIVPDQADRAFVVVDLGSGGGATAQFMLGGPARPASELAVAGTRLSVLFADAYSVRSVVEDNNAGIPYLRVVAQRVFATGDHAQVDIDFVTKKGYGKNVMQRNAEVLNTLEAAKKGKKT